MNFLKKNYHLLLLWLIILIPFIISNNVDFEFFIWFDKFDFQNLFLTRVDKDFWIIPWYFSPIYYLYSFLNNIFWHKYWSIMIWWSIYFIWSTFILLVLREFVKLYWLKSNKLSEFIAGCFYAFFIPSQFLPAYPFTFNMPYVLFPILIYLLLKYFNSLKRNYLSLSICISLVCFLFSWVQIVFLIFIFLWCLLFLLYGFFMKKIKVKESIKIILLSVFFYVLLSLPYNYTSIYLPLFTQQNLVNEILTIETPAFTQSNSFIIEVLKWMGSTSFYYFHQWEFSIPSAVPYFQESLYILLSYLWIFLFIAFIILNKKYTSIKILLLWLFLGSTFFMQGINNPWFLKDIYIYIYNHLFYFQMFRNWYKAYFLLLFVYSVSVGFLMIILNQTKFYKKISILFLLLILFLWRPIYEVNFYKFIDIQVPNDIKESISYINNNLENKRILIVPITPFPVYSFSNRWVDPYELSTSFKTFTNVNSAWYKKWLVESIEYAISRNDSLGVKEKLKKYNIEYILWTDYVDTNQYLLPLPIDSLSFYKDNFKEVFNLNNKIIIFKS